MKMANRNATLAYLARSRPDLAAAVNNGSMSAAQAFSTAIAQRNPMRRNFGDPAPAAPPSPKWLQSLSGLANGILGAIEAPAKALNGQYQPVIDPTAPGGVDPYTPMIPDALNLAGLTTLGAGAAPAEADALNMGIRAYHGSPHSFDKFSSANIGTGEGTQAYGHGLYFAGNEDVARTYRDALSDAPGKGSMYAVDINAEPSQMLDWDKPLSEQPPAVQDVLSSHIAAINAQNAEGDAAIKTVFPSINISAGPPEAPKTGGAAYDFLSTKRGNAAAASALRDAGVPGIQYLDAGSRRAGDGTRNYVIFDDSLVNILKKYGIFPGAIGAGTIGGAVLGQPPAPPAVPGSLTTLGT